MPVYPNGRAPASALINIYGCVASPDMARRVRYVKEEYDRTHSDNLSVNEIYRTFEQQVYQKARWTALGQPGNAATPGYSNHGAWDIGAVDWSCDDVAGRRAIAARVGLIHNIANESWHAAAIGPITVPLPDLAGLNITPLEENVALNDEDKAYIKQAIIDVMWAGDKDRPSITHAFGDHMDKDREDVKAEVRKERMKLGTDVSAVIKSAADRIITAITGK